MTLDPLRFPNRSVLDDALRRCRIALVRHTRERLQTAYPQDAEARVAAAVGTLARAKKNAEAVARSGVISHDFNDDFALLEISHVGVLLSTYSLELIGSPADADPVGALTVALG